MLLNCGAVEDSWESLGSKEIKPVNPKWNQSWIFIGRTDDEAEASILWLPEAKNWLIKKDPDAGKDWRLGEKGTIEDEMVGWHHWLDVHEFEQAPGVGDRQGSLACCSPWGHKELDLTEWLNWTKLGRLLRVPWTERRSNQSVLKEINPEEVREKPGYVGVLKKKKKQVVGI